MLSGVKFIPRDQLLPANSESDGSEKEGDNSRKLERRKKKKQQPRGSSVDDEKAEREKSSERGKKKRRSKEYSSDGSLDSSDSGNEYSMESEEERKSKRSRRGKRKTRDSSEDSYSSDEYEKRKRGKRKHGKVLMKKKDEGKSAVRKEVSDIDHNELVRKEMGLEWMLSSGSRKDNNPAKVDSEPEKEDPQVEEVGRMNPRELNPYFRDNGSGYPDEASPSEAGSSQLLSSSVVGDGGASWRLKALKRSKEQAAREGRKLDEVVEERWGSLGHLAASVAARRAAPTHAHLHAIRDRKKGLIEKPEKVLNVELEGSSAVRTGSRDYLRDVSSRHPEMRKPKQDSLHWKKNRNQNISEEARSLISEAVSGLNKFSNDGSFMDSVISVENKDAGVSNTSFLGSKEANDHREEDIVASKAKDSNEVCLVSKQGLTANQLAAKVLQLRMKGKHEEADNLSKEMEEMVAKQDTGTNMVRQETVGNRSRFIEKQISSERKKREEDADLHLAQKIMQNKQYSLSKRADDEYDFDGEALSRKRNQKKEGMHAEKKIIPKRILTQQERCQFCFENPSRPKHLVVAIGNFTYMMLPQWQPVVQGHCCILPMQHDSSTRTVDKNVWEEIRNFKKCLLRMFARQDMDVLFIETVIGLARQRRHCLIECIPVPCAVAKEAPMYFKKAIDEAEDEWGQHEMKKVIPTSGNLRHVIPENLSYFHVEFGLDRGFVHVIDDDTNFSSSFGLNVVRGMFRLPEEDMHRRRRQEPLEKQKQAVSSFAGEWDPFDWTKDLD